MTRFLTLAFLALLAVAEVAAVLALVDRFGGPVALLVLFLDVVAGLAVIRWGARSLPPARGWRIAAGAFIALPGLVLDLVGLALLVPPIQRWVVWAHPARHRGCDAQARSLGDHRDRRQRGPAHDRRAWGCDPRSGRGGGLPDARLIGRERNGPGRR